MRHYEKVMLYRVVTLSWPVILEMSGVMLTGALTTAMVGRLGAVDLTAVGIATMVQMASAMIVAAFGTGASAIVGRESGAGQWQEVRRITGQALVLGALAGTAVAAIGYGSARPLFRLIGLDADVAGIAASLLEILFLFTPAFLVMAVGNAVLRGLAKTRTAFYIGTFSNLLSLLLAYMLIFGSGLPRLGSIGVAWGVGLSQLAGGAAALAVLKRDAQIGLRWRDLLRWKQPTVRRILHISLPAAMEQAALQSGRVTFTLLLTGVGAVQFAAHQIATQVETFSFLPGFGFSVAAMTLVAQSLGKRRPLQAERFVRVVGRMAVASMSFMALLFLIFAEPLTGLFIEDPRVIGWGTYCVMLAAFEQPTIALTYVWGGALRGAGDTRWPMYVTVLGVWIFRMPIVYLCVAVFQLSILSVWAVTALDFLLRSIVLWKRFRTGAWKLS